MFVCLSAAVFFRRGGLAATPVNKHPGRGVLETDCTSLGCGLVGESGSVALAAAAGEPLFLFIGILSGRGYRHRRLAVRESWSGKAQIPGVVVSKFVLSEDERTPQVEKEVEAYDDVIFVKEATNYKSILFKTFFVMEYAVRHFDVKFVLKTDDDAFIHVTPMVHQLRALCETPGCAQERLYIGKMATSSEVLLQPGHKWNNEVFHNHTGLKQYPNYMMGGGYVISGEVCRVLVDVHARMHLKFTPIEDATLGFWLMAMDLRHIDHPKFYTWAAPCCFKSPIRKQGTRLTTRFQMTEEFAEDLCSDDPWLVLHKIDSPTKMRFVGTQVSNCTFDGHVLAPSIAPFVPAAKLGQYKLGKARLERRPATEPHAAAGSGVGADLATAGAASGAVGSSGAAAVGTIGDSAAPVATGGGAAAGLATAVADAVASGAATSTSDAAASGGAVATLSAQTAVALVDGHVPGGTSPVGELQQTQADPAAAVAEAGPAGAAQVVQAAVGLPDQPGADSAATAVVRPAGQVQALGGEQLADDAEAAFRSALATAQQVAASQAAADAAAAVAATA